MARVQIQLPPDLQRRARARAAALGVSLAEYIRRLLLADLGEARKLADPKVVIVLGDSGGADVARHKDEMISDSFARRAKP